MGQWQVYEAIRALGGKNVTARQIHEFLESADPSHRRQNISVTQLYIKRLCAAGLVSKKPYPGMRCGTWMYSIAAEYPKRNVVVAAAAATIPPPLHFPPQQQRRQRHHQQQRCCDMMT